MKTTEELTRVLQSDGSWKKDALHSIMVMMEACAPWQRGETRVEGGWSPKNPWISESREAEYVELLRLGCRCIRESQDMAGIVQFGLNIFQDFITLHGETRARLCAELQHTGLMSLWHRLYQAHLLGGLDPRIPGWFRALPAPDSLLRFVR